MAGKEDYRIFVGGLAWDVTERQLERTFGRFGKVIEYRRGMEDAIREMHGRELGDRVISVNKAEPKMSDDLNHGSYRGSYSGGGRGNYSGGGGGGERSFGHDECFKCGRLGHWARECPSAGGGGARGAGGPPPPFSSQLRYGAAGDRFGERERYFDDRYDGGRYGERDRFESSRDMKYAGRDRYVADRYPPGGDRFASDRYGGPDRYPQNGSFGKERAYERDVGPRGVGDRYGGGGPVRADDRSYRSRPGPYDRPARGRPSSFERY